MLFCGLICFSQPCSAETVDFRCYSTEKGLGIYTKNVPEDAKLELSFDGGKNFFRVANDGKFFPSLPHNKPQRGALFQTKQYH